jgi:hypothetical protein
LSEANFVGDRPDCQTGERVLWQSGLRGNFT